MTNDSTMSPVRHILAAPWQQQRNQGGLWPLLAIAGLMALGPVAMVATGWQDHHVMVAAGCVAVGELAVLLAMAWAYLAASVLEQNRAVAARLVPGNVRALRRVMVGGWAVTVAGVTALVAPLFAVLLDLQLPGQAIAEPTLLVVVATAVIASVIAAAVRWQAAWIVACLTPVSISSMAQTRWGPALWSALQAGWQAAPWPIAMAVLAGGAVLCVQLIQTGGASHVRNYDQRKERLARLHRRTLGADDAPICDGLFGRLARLRVRPFEAVMRRLVERRGSAAMPRLMLTLGPGAHWTTQLVNIGLFLVAGTVGVACLAVFSNPVTSPSFASDVLIGWSVGAIYVFAAPALQLPVRLQRTQREQALLALLPGVPRGAALSRALSLRLTAQFLAIWLLGLVVVMAGVAIGQRLGSDGPLDTFAGLGGFASPMVLSLLLPVGPALWRHWARMAPPSQLSGLWVFLLPVLAATGAFALEHRGLATNAEIAAVFIAVPLAWCTLRWLRMGREPTALPVGRLRR